MPLAYCLDRYFDGENLFNDLDLTLQKVDILKFVVTMANNLKIKI